MKRAPESVQKGWFSSQKRPIGDNFSRWLAAIMLGFVLGSPLQAQTVSAWNGATSNWSNAADWSNGVPNSNTDFAQVTVGGSIVSVDGAFTVGELSIANGNSLGIDNGESLTVDASNGFAGAGTITNAGALSINATTNTTYLTLNGNTTLTGGGTVNLVTNDIVGGSGNLTNVNNTIQGETNSGGTLGQGQIGIVNQANGLIDANVSGLALVVDPGGAALTNTGMMEASGGGILDLDGVSGAFTNTGGTIEALTGSQVELSNNASITGGTLTTAGTGTIQNVGTASLTSLTNSGTFIGNNASTTTIAGTITNSGSISINGTANTTFLDINSSATLTGNGTVNLVTNDFVGGSGTLTNVNNTIQGDTNNGGTLGSGQIGINNEAGGLIDANVSGKALVVYPGAAGVTNSGTMEASNGGNLVLEGGGGGVFTNTGGTIQALAGSQVGLTAGASIIGGTLNGMIQNMNDASLTSLTNSGTFIGNPTTTTTIAGTINNTGSFVIAGVGQTSFLNINGNTTLTGAGTLYLVGGDAVVGGAGTLTNNSTIQGSGTLGNGAIAIQNNSLISANLAGQTLTVNPTSFTNNAGGTASATNGGILDFTGAVTNNGTLNAQAGSTITVGGALTGSGAVTGVGTLMTANFTSNGTVTPGEGGNPGALTINGNYTQGANGTLVIQVNGTTPGTGFSVLNVSGTASLGGTLQLQSNGLFPGTTGQLLTFLNAGTVTNGTTFATLNNLSGINFSVVVNANNVQLLVTQNLMGFARPGLTPNQFATGTYIDSVVPTATGSVATLIGALNVVPVSGLPSVLDQISPQSLQVWRSIAFDGVTFSNQTVSDHLANRRDGLTGFDGSQLTYTDSTLDPALAQIKSRFLAWSPAPTPGLLSDTTDPVMAGVDMKERKTAPMNETPDDPWSTFIAGNVILADLNHDQDLAHQDYTTGSVMLGADYQLDPHFTVGGLLAYGHTDATLDHIGSKTTDDSYSPGVYASYVDGGWYGNGLFSYGYNSYTSDRNIQIGSLSGANLGATQGNLYAGNLTGGYEFKRNAWKFGPVASLQYAHLDIDSFSEQGPSALNIASQSDDSLRSQLGMEVRYAGHVQGWFGSSNLTPHISATWQHEFMENSGGITSQFNGTGAGSFTVQSSSPERDSAFIDAGIDSQVADNVIFFTDYQTQVGQSHFFAQSVQAGFKVGF